MKPFKINRNSWHYKLNKSFLNSNSYYMKERWEHLHSDFCSYWRATISRAMIIIVLTSIFSFFAFVTGSIVYTFPLETLKVFGFTVGFIIFMMSLIVAANFINYIFYKKSYDSSIFVQKIKSVKNKYCAFVEYGD